MKAYKFFPVVLKISLVILSVAAFMAFYAGEQTADLPAQRQKDWERISSISFLDGKYKIDSSIIWKKGYKEMLLKDLKSERLVEINKVEKIPLFIQAFLDSMSPCKKFRMANPDDAWQVGNITDFGGPPCLTPDGKNCEEFFREKRCLPDKKLAYFGLGENIALFSYYRGGINISQVMVIVRFRDSYFAGKQIADFWFSNGSAYVTTKEEIIKYISLNPTNGC